MPNIFLVGPMGSGKSTIGKLVAAELSLEFVDSDKEIEERAGADISWIFDVEGENGFRQREMAVIDDLSQRQNIVLATGGGAVINPEVRTLLKSRGKIIYLNAPLEVLLSRTELDKTRPLLQVSDPQSTLQKILEDRGPLYQELADIEVSSEARSSKQIVTEIVKFISENPAES